MYAVCSIATGSISGIGGISSFGRVWIWVAVAVWVLVFAATLSRASGSPGKRGWPTATVSGRLPLHRRRLDGGPATYMYTRE
jgi:hypothetical protein